MDEVRIPNLKFKIQNGAILAALGCLWSFPCLAQPDTHLPAKTAEVGVHRKSFNELTPEERQKLREKRARFQELPPAEQARIQKHLKYWKELSPEQRDRLRSLHGQLEYAAPQNQDAFRKKGREFQQLPPEKQREKIRRMAQAEPSPEFQKRVESQYPVIWADLPPEQRRMLARMHQRVENARETTTNVPPEQRAALEERLKKFSQLSPEAQKERLQKMADHRKKRMQDP